MQVISFISAALHLSLGVDASPIPSSTSLEFAPSSDLSGRDVQFSLQNDGVLAPNGASSGRKSELVPKHEINQQGTVSEGSMDFWSKKKRGKLFTKVKEMVEKKLSIRKNKNNNKTQSVSKISKNKKTPDHKKVKKVKAQEPTKAEDGEEGAKNEDDKKAQEPTKAEDGEEGAKNEDDNKDQEPAEADDGQGSEDDDN
ncbi:hypothetical protein DSO57_1008296 [Entomophthora muscae]|uniref:Uncharacterized protein n=2 Tax=Entomophthora muscae TaxID=34485 RepID=A0ACC2UT94_9FUNG|nr:hypothetical protein DSO57_1008295 [Entomophthora muscae]KAJ9089895.1 hypothetical protein DSO57_1008296 [Entomophthora muscae]